jgi:hypothetical protein
VSGRYDSARHVEQLARVLDVSSRAVVTWTTYPAGDGGTILDMADVRRPLMGETMARARREEAPKMTSVTGSLVAPRR